MPDSSFFGKFNSRKRRGMVEPSIVQRASTRVAGSLLRRSLEPNRRICSIARQNRQNANFLPRFVLQAFIGNQSRLHRRSIRNCAGISCDAMVSRIRANRSMVRVQRPRSLNVDYAQTNKTTRQPEAFDRMDRTNHRKQRRKRFEFLFFQRVFHRESDAFVCCSFEKLPNRFGNPVRFEFEFIDTLAFV